MKNLTTQEITSLIYSILTPMGFILNGPTERWERDGVMHIFTLKACIEYTGKENPYFGRVGGGSVIITGVPGEDYCEPLRKAGIWSHSYDYSEQFTSSQELTDLLTKVRPYI